MKIIVTLFWIAGLFALPAFAQSPVTLTIDAKSHGPDIPWDFAGVSIFTGTQVRDHRGVPGNLFSGTNGELITLFKNTGIRHLRLGATGSARSDAQNLSHEDIDSLFAFARAADIKVIYSLHFFDGVATAKYVWDNYRTYVDYFAYDNEPDGRALDDADSADSGSPGYFTEWRDFARSVVQAVPGAKFAGPDAAGRTLVARFVKAEKDSGSLALVTQHIYVDGNPRKKGIDTSTAIEHMLSADWVSNKYPQLYNTVLLPVKRRNLPFRLTESDDYVHGVTNASDAFCSALWALDYMHWWAAHGAAGVNFQNTEWLRTDTFYLDSAGNYQIHPKAYGIKAFDVGGHGTVQPLLIRNEGGLNLTSYAARDGRHLFVTIINKEHGPGARGASVTIITDGFFQENAGAMFLTAPNGDVGATTGVTLGGATITNNAPWLGQWTPLMSSPTTDRCKVLVPAASAAVIGISERQNSK